MTFTEDQLVEQPTLALLESMGYQHLDGYQESFDPSFEYSTLGRRTHKDVLLTARLLQEIQRLNPGLTLGQAKEALIILEETGLNKQANKANKDIYRLLKDGIKLSIHDEKTDHTEIQTVRLFDFDDYHNNDFVVVNQLTIQGEHYKRRPDLLVFVNGIPLVNIELKGPLVDIIDAYHDNLQDYKDTIPMLWRYNAFVILSNGSQSKMGTFSSPWNFFKEWKRLNEEEQGETSIEQMIKGTMQKEALMDIVENFILHQERDGKVINIVAQNHQYLGVNESFESVKNRKKSDGKLGVFWHTQGSGKSFSMVFLANKVMRKLPGNFTFVVLTDRTELDDQICDTFTRVGANKEGRTVQADSVKDLRTLLSQDHRFVFTLIHKFQDRDLEVHPTISERSDIIVMVDEAHRTQYDQLALNMRNALPNAQYIAFTGTPLLKGSRVTENIFGGYVSKYNFKKAVDDGATVPIYYENRAPKLKLYDEDFTDKLSSIYDAYGLDDEQAEQFSREYKTQYKLITRDDVLDTVAQDIINHYFWQEGYWKAMVVSVDINTTIRMYDKVQEKIQDLVKNLEAELSTANLFRKQEIDKVFDKIANFDSAVVASFGSTQNDAKMKELGVDRAKHRAIMAKRNLQDEFKVKGGGLKMVFVCNMWLTGLDVPDLRTLYLHKPMQGHTLMQTIARVNRVAEEKENGMIVDYLNLFKNLQMALADYASDNNKEYPAQDKEELLEQLQESLTLSKNYLSKETGVQLEELIQANGGEKLSLLSTVANGLFKTDTVKKEWNKLAGRSIALYSSLLPDERANEFTVTVHTIKAIVIFLKKAVSTNVDMKALKGELDLLLDESILVEEFDFEKEGFFKDLSKLNANALQKLFDKDTENIGIQRLKEALKHKIDEMLKTNPFALTFKSDLEEIIKKYNSNKTELEEIYQLLVSLAHDLDELEKQEAELGMTEEERIIFLKIYKKGLTSKDEEQIKEVARELYQKVLEVRELVFDWKEKTQGRAMMFSGIRGLLFDHVPIPAYDQHDAEEKTKAVYEYAFEYL